MASLPRADVHATLGVHVTSRPAAERSAAVAWYLWGAVAAATLYVSGFYWDISWHQTIGRDSFWNPAHIAIYLSGIVGGISCGYLVLFTTFNRSTTARAASVTVWGFRAPLGAFIVAWGGVLMLSSAPLDNWWHSAYGLDAKLNSPPHWILTVGVFALQIGGMVLLAGAMNRGSGRLRRKLTWLLLYLGTTVIALPLVLANNRVLLHSALCYAAVCAATPVVLLTVARASGWRWACTIVAAIYMIYVTGFLWILPLFSGSPRLGPVYQTVTHFIPPGFPLLLVVPAFLLDCLRTRWSGWNGWLQSLAAGAVFLLAFVAVQWPFADFLMSPAARTWAFGSHYLPYFTSPTSHLGRNEYYLEKTHLQFWIGMAAALSAAVLSSRLGVTAGNWLARVRR